MPHYTAKGRVALNGPRLAFTARNVPGSLVVESGLHAITVTIEDEPELGDDPIAMTGEYTDGTVHIALVGHHIVEMLHTNKGCEAYHTLRMDAEHENWQHLWLEVTWTA